MNSRIAAAVTILLAVFVSQNGNASETIPVALYDFFVAADADGDKIVSEDENAAAIERVRASLKTRAEEKWREMFSLVEAPVQDTVTLRQMVRHYKDWVRRLDRDGNGTTDKIEIAFHLGKLDERSRVGLQEIIREIDDDGNGAISQAELDTYSAAAAARPNVDEVITRDSLITDLIAEGETDIQAFEKAWRMYTGQRGVNLLDLIPEAGRED